MGGSIDKTKKDRKLKWENPQLVKLNKSTPTEGTPTYPG